MMENGLQAVLRYLPVPVRSAVQQMPAEMQTRIREVPPACGKAGGSGHTATGAFPCDRTEHERSSLPRHCAVSQRTLEQTFQAVCSYSVYCYAREMRQGFVTVDGGNRVGVAGSAAYRDGVLTQVHHYITGLTTFAFHTASRDVQKSCTGRACSSRPQSVLLAGAAGSGKTTHAAGHVPAARGRTPCFSH